MKAKKHLGQNFLTSIPARLAIAKAGELSKKDTVLEIGPGRGFLTEELLQSGAHVVALEKDEELIPLLVEMFGKKKNFTLIEGDVLLFNPRDHGFKNGKYKIIANIPYYITGAIFELFLANQVQPEQMVVLIQKEVAERIVAKDKESILSLSIKAYGAPKIVYRVNKGSFNPAPKVDSAVLSISNIGRKNFKNDYHEAMFFKLVKAGFAHKRKMLASNLKHAFPNLPTAETLSSLGIPEKARAEDVSLELWLALSLKISKMR